MNLTLKNIALSLFILLMAMNYGTLAAKEKLDLTKKEKQILIKNLKTYMNNINEDEVLIQNTPIKGLYAVIMDNFFFYSGKKGENIMQGSLISLKDGENWSTALQSKLHANTIKSINAKDTIIFSPENILEKAKIVYVFTDTECPYCQKLHEAIPEINKAGIEVRYLAFPRRGINSKGYTKLVNAFCSDDKKDAIIKLFEGKSIASKQCKNPVAAQYNLGQEIQIRGTPATMLLNGEKLEGFGDSASYINQINKLYEKKK